MTAGTPSFSSCPRENVASSASYWEKYAGLSAEKALVLKTDVDAYSGATISSKALNAAVNAAIEAYNMIP